MKDVIYTILPLDLVLKDFTQDKEPSFQNVIYEGVEMQVEPLEWNQFRIIRLLSTNPSHYLDNNLQPGSIISF
ncbi:MAG: YlzJ-like family protein [Bacillota bacterium]